MNDFTDIAAFVESTAASVKTTRGAVIIAWERKRLKLPSFAGRRTFVVRRVLSAHIAAGARRRRIGQPRWPTAAAGVTRPASTPSSRRTTRNSPFWRRVWSVTRTLSMTSSRTASRGSK